MPATMRTEIDNATSSATRSGGMFSCPATILKNVMDRRTAISATPAAMRSHAALIPVILTSLSANRAATICKTTEVPRTTISSMVIPRGER